MYQASFLSTLDEAQRSRTWINHQHRRGIEWRTVQKPIGARTNITVFQASFPSALNKLKVAETCLQLSEVTSLATPGIASGMLTVSLLPILLYVAAIRSKLITTEGKMTTRLSCAHPNLRRH